MAGETTITVVGNLTADPELRFTQSGAAVASFTVASTPRTFDKQSGEWKDGEALFLRCNVWRQVAENVAESLTRGSRVLVSGRCASVPSKRRKARSALSWSLRSTRSAPRCATRPRRSTRSAVETAAVAAASAAAAVSSLVAAVAHRQTTRGVPPRRPAIGGFADEPPF